MLDIIKKSLSDSHIHNVGIISIDDCDIINPRLLPEYAKSAIMLTVPYRTTRDIASDGFSEYSRIYDYHGFFYSLFDKIIPELSAKTSLKLQGFCDHSPINEKLAAAKAGLGIIGKNSLFIDNDYGSFVFIATIITDWVCTEPAKAVRSCENCGLCLKACPVNAVCASGIDSTKCLSAISQKKHKTDDDIALLKKHGIVWGCDICQLACPHNKDAKLSPVKYFADSRISEISFETISHMNDLEFAKFAFAYKGRKTVENSIHFVQF